MTDSTGTVVWAADYKPFGEATVTVSAITNNLRFPGQYYDTETGNHYNYRRDYNITLGRYTEADPIGLRGGISLYVYVRNRPINRTDSFGLSDDIDPTGFYDSSGAGSGMGYFSVGAAGVSRGAKVELKTLCWSRLPGPVRQSWVRCLLVLLKWGYLWGYLCVLSVYNIQYINMLIELL